MADPFQNVSAAGSEFIEIFARQLEVRAAEPDMIGIVEAYLDDLPWDDITLAVEVGCGTGPVARRMARRSSCAQVVGIEPSPELVRHARGLAEGIAFLPGFMEAFNTRFARIPRRPDNLHRPLNVEPDRLRDIFCLRDERYVGQQLDTSCLCEIGYEGWCGRHPARLLGR